MRTFGCYAFGDFFILHAHAHHGIAFLVFNTDVIGLRRSRQQRSTTHTPAAVWLDEHLLVLSLFRFAFAVRFTHHHRFALSPIPYAVWRLPPPVCIPLLHFTHRLCPTVIITLPQFLLLLRIYSTTTTTPCPAVVQRTYFGSLLTHPTLRCVCACRTSAATTLLRYVLPPGLCGFSWFYRLVGIPHTFNSTTAVMPVVLFLRFYSGLIFQIPHVLLVAVVGLFCVAYLPGTVPPCLWYFYALPLPALALMPCLAWFALYCAAFYFACLWWWWVGWCSGCSRLCLLRYLYSERYYPTDIVIPIAFLFPSSPHYHCTTFAFAFPFCHTLPFFPLYPTPLLPPLCLCLPILHTVYTLFGSLPLLPRLLFGWLLVQLQVGSGLDYLCPQFLPYLCPTHPHPVPTPTLAFSLPPYPHCLPYPLYLAPFAPLVPTPCPVALRSIILASVLPVDVTAGQPPTTACLCLIYPFPFGLDVFGVRVRGGKRTYLCGRTLTLLGPPGQEDKTISPCMPACHHRALLTWFCSDSPYLVLRYPFRYPFSNIARYIRALPAQHLQVTLPFPPFSPRYQLRLRWFVCCRLVTPPPRAFYAFVAENHFILHWDRFAAHVFQPSVFSGRIPTPVHLPCTPLPFVTRGCGLFQTLAGFALAGTERFAAAAGGGDGDGPRQRVPALQFIYYLFSSVLVHLPTLPSHLPLVLPSVQVLPHLSSPPIPPYMSGSTLLFPLPFCLYTFVCF